MYNATRKASDTKADLVAMDCIRFTRESKNIAASISENRYCFTGQQRLA